jgi:hypothetical protein
MNISKFVAPNTVFDTSTSFLRNVTFDSSVYLQGVTHISSPGVTGAGTPYALVVDALGADASIQAKLLGTMAFETSTNYYGKTAVDNLIADVSGALDTRLDFIDTSIAGLDSLTRSHTAHLAQLDASVIRIDASLNDVIDILSLGFATNASVGLAFGLRDTSIAWLNTNKVNLAGDTMTGTLTVPQVNVSTLLIDGISIVGIDTSAEGFGVGLDTHIPTSALVKSAIAAAIAAGVTADNGLIEQPDGNIELGGLLTRDTSIDVNGHSLSILAGNKFSILSGTDASKGIIVAGNGDITIGSGGTALITLKGDELILDAPGKDSLTLNTSGTTFASPGSHGGIKYATDLKGNYTSLSLITLGDLNSSIGAVWTKFGSVDTSLTNLGIKDAAIDTSLVAIDSSIFDIWLQFGYVNSSLNGLDSSIVTLNTAISNINSSLGTAYVKKTGDTMTGPLNITGGGLQVGIDISDPQDVSIFGGLFVKRGLVVKGNLTVDGSVTFLDTTQLDISTAYIQLNTGLTGTPPPSLQSGIIVNRGSADPYAIVYDESLQQFRIGQAKFTGGQYDDSSTQAVATRQDAPNANGVAYWNSAAYRMDTTSGFTFVPGTGLSIPTITSDPTATAALFTVGGLVKTRTLGSNAFNSDAYVLQSLFDTSIAAVWTKFGSVDTSLNGIWTKLGSVDTSLNAIWTKEGYQDSSISALDLLTQIHTTGIADLSTNAIRGVASTTGVVPTNYEIYSGEADNIAYIKRLVAGAGVTITSDSSVLTIAVGGTTGVQKYKGTFDGTAASPFTVLATTHGLGIGPLQVAVYESGAQVYTAVDINGSGDVTLGWGPGSLTDASCKFIITG